MNDWNKDIEELLKPLKDVRPTDFELQKWKRAAFQEQRAHAPFSKPFFQRSLQFAAAGLAGFFVGWAVFGSGLLNHPTGNNLITASNDNATVEVILSN